jgi:PAS domain S-box-containing protein
MIINNHSLILESMPIGVIVTDLGGNIKTMNKHARSIMKMLDNPIYNKHMATLLGDRNMASIRSSFQSESCAEANGFKITRRGKILEIVGAPLNGENDVIAGTVFTIRDITEAEKNQELEKDHEKHAAIGKLSADIAHEIRNPLGSIELFASLLKKELKRKKDINRVNQIITAARNVANRISSLILFSKTCQIPVKHVNIHEILKDILLFSEQIIDQETIFLSAQYANIDPIIECNPDMVKQVFLNLILNALQAIPDGGRLDIVTSYISDIQTIEIHFIDSSPLTLENVCGNTFDRLSKTNGRSSGLGLAVMYNIINMYKGSIRMEYIEGGGSAFILSFPVINVQTQEIDPNKKPIEEKATNG